MQTEKTIYALGFFDGVHLGHQALLTACRNLAQQHCCRAGVVTFTSHPDELVSQNAPALIHTIEDRKRLLLQYGAETILALTFDPALMRMPWQDFLEDLLARGSAGFVCGADFRFGYKGEGTSQKLADFCERRGLPHAVVPEQTVNSIRVSSSYIRQLLKQGDIEAANRFLGHPHTLSGTVISGRGLGHTIGIPTANLPLPEGVLVPRLGVYACMATVDGAKYPAVTNIGFRPTVEGHHITVESWLLDFDCDLYGKKLILDFYRFLRPEQKFDSLAELKAEIEKNAAQTRKIFKNT